MKKNNLLSLMVMLFIVFRANAQCSYTGTPLTQVGSDYTFCIDNMNTYTTGTVNAGQYVVVNVVKGFTYTFSVGNAFSTTERLTILDASTNGNVSPSATASGSSGTSISGWISSLSGKIKILLSKGSCLNDNTIGGALTLSLTAVGNTQDSQTAYGTDQWIGHVYNWTGTAPPGGTSPSSPSTTSPFSNANYVGYYTVPTETISEGFGGDGNCFPIYSNGVVRANIYTEQFAVRYRMRSTKTGCYMFSATGDDGIRVYVDGVKVYDEWKEQSPTAYANVLLYLNGNSDIIFDYYENGGQNVNSFTLTPFDTTSNIVTPSVITVCSGVSSGLLNGSSYPYSGTTTNPSITFQWQSSTDNITFSNINGATSEDYTPPTQTTSSSNIVTYYRRITAPAASNASACTTTSNVVKVTTSPSTPNTPGNISGITSQCETLAGQVYSITEVVKAVSYIWTIPTGWSITAGAGTNSITVTTGSAGQNGNISVSATNGCGTSAVKTLAVTVNSVNTVGTASSSPTLCINTSMSNINHTTTGATGIGTATGLPTGVSATWSSNTITISGTPTSSGTFIYTVPLVGGCGTVNASGTIIVTPIKTVSTASASPTLCNNTALTAITHITTGATGIGSANGLPNGVTASWVTNTITISGTPTQTGTFNYSIPLNGGCGNGVNATGTITVTANKTVGIASSMPTICINTALTTITHTTTGATGIGSAIGLPNGVTATWANNTITISGTPTNSGVFNYSIPLTGGCGTVNATGTITVNVLTVGGTLAGSANVCSNSNSTTLTLSGHTGSIVKWQSCPNSSFVSNVTDISNTTTTYTAYSVTTTTYYRAVVTNGSCSSAYSSTASITVTTAASGNFVYSAYGFCNSISTSQSISNSNFTGVLGTYSSTIGLTLNPSTGAIIPSTSTASSTAYTITYTVPASGGCPTYSTTTAVTIEAAGSGTITYTPSTICSSTAGTILPTISGAAGTGASTWISASPSGLSIDGTGIITPTGSIPGTYTVTYNRSASGFCPTYSNSTSVTLTSSSSATVSVASSTPTLCINTALTAITHNTTGATGIGTAIGLPSGVTASWAANTITISGVPLVAGTFNYTIPLSISCGTLNAIGTIVVTGTKTVGVASSSPILCINTALTAITHTTTGATGIGTATGLPTGVTAVWASNTITISGTPINSGTFNYSIPLTGGCGTANATGMITVTANKTVGAASSSPTLCINTALTAITHITTGAIGIGAAMGLPTGVSATWASNTITISGTPTNSGTFNYNIPLTGGCGTANATGIITVTANKTVGAASSSPTLCINTALPAVTHTTTGATGIGTATGLPTGVTTSWASNTITISGTPTNSGTFNYSIPLTGGCGIVNATGTIIVVPTAVGGTVSGGSTVCSGNTSGLLTLTGHIGTIVRWEYAVSPFTNWTSIVNTQATFTSWNISETTKFRAVVQSGVCGEQISTSATISINSTTWSNGVWSNGNPTSTTLAIISDNYTSSGTLSACSLTLNNNAIVVISSGDSVALRGPLTVTTGSNITFNNNANLFQEGTTNQNTGVIKIKRNSSALMRQDYTLWSSPVADQQLLNFSPSTLTNRFYTYNTGSNLYDVVTPSSTNFEAAKGYLIRMPNNHPATPTIWTGQFTGVPNNGNYSFSLIDAGIGNRFNLVGNPYPSPIDINAFVNNANNSTSIAGALYFWRKTNNAANPTYCTWTKGGFVTNGQTQVYDPNDVIQTGQGFFVEASGMGTTVNFDNTMRIDNHANQFFKTSNAIERNRIWLNATSSSGLFSQTMIGYITNATQGYDPMIDGKYMNNGEIAITSLIENTSYAIQGRALPFNDTDVVPISFKATNAGNYTISIDHVDGLFLGSQGIYLRDNLLGTVNDLSTSGYSFISEAGTFDSRFEILFQSSLLGVVTHPEFNANQVVLYKDLTNNLVISSGVETISSVKIFDMSGKLLFEKKNIDSNKTAMNIGLSNEIVLVQITSDKGITVTKKFLVQRVSAKEEKFKMEKVQLAEDE